MPKQSVFLLYHSRPLESGPSPDTDDKLCGVFSSESTAVKAKEQLLLQPGFREWPEEFIISRNEIDKLEWAEGFISWEEALKDL